MIVDGYGFHEGFFARRRYIGKHAIPTHLSGYAQRVFDQGLGRAIWFSCGGVINLVVSMIGGFQPERRADLWAGVGLASAYGGGADRTSLFALRAYASPYQSQLARGAATAAGQWLAGNRSAHTDLACEVFCGMPSKEAAQILDTAREGLTAIGTQPVYESWRQRTEALLAV